MACACSRGIPLILATSSMLDCRYCVDWMAPPYPLDHATAIPISRKAPSPLASPVSRWSGRSQLSSCDHGSSRQRPLDSIPGSHRVQQFQHLSEPLVVTQPLLVRRIHRIRVTLTVTVRKDNCIHPTRTLRGILSGNFHSNIRWNSTEAIRFGNNVALEGSAAFVYRLSALGSYRAFQPRMPSQNCSEAMVCT